MPNIKLTIEYDGTQFKGWQIQPKDERTVQGLITETFYKIFKEKIKLIGSGRTDSGVHALGQVANFQTQCEKSPTEIRNALNAYLPTDISIVNAVKVSDDFHAQYSVKSKTYRYTIFNRDVRSAVQQNHALLFPYDLDLNLMKFEAQSLIGTHDFTSFKGNNRSEKEENNVRTIYSIKITKKNNLILIDVTANGFLYKMVRNIVGMLLEVGSGRVPKGRSTNVLKKKDRTLSAYTAKAHGLTLLKVKY
ncbi:MAG: tRNA pseudouridine(38-40) synthase TruA [Candidatus Omnitrophica bacterium]|nr:tRNA pseudouridine(38-40) synthase TruA [Candidatus Omnitrophota bacterium]